MKSISFNEFRDFVHNSDVQYTEGKCNICKRRKICLKDNKENHIFSISTMKKNDTRFPLILDFVKNNSFILDSIPSFVFEKLYGGNSSNNLPCPFMAQKIADNLDKIEEVYNSLDDLESKNCYLNILLYRLLLDRKYAKNAFSNDTQYFIDEFVGLNSNEIYVDCGAYIGDTVNAYLENNDFPKKMYLFEPDSNNVNLLKSNLNYCKGEVSIIPNGLYDNNCSLWFVSNSESSSSYFSETPQKNAMKIDVVCLDKVINENVSFVKMDIEGFEKKALAGGQRIISTHLPKLAVCIYHSVEDMWEVPLYIINTFEGYKHFKIRHYTHNFRETVFYAF